MERRMWDLALRGEFLTYILLHSEYIQRYKIGRFLLKAETGISCTMNLRSTAVSQQVVVLLA